MNRYLRVTSLALSPKPLIDFASRKLTLGESLLFIKNQNYKLSSSISCSTTLLVA